MLQTTFYTLFIMINTIPRTQFCKKCSNRNTPTHRGNCNKNLYTKITFLDWEKYLEGKSYNGKRCDLILDRESETTLFIEHKVKDWFDLRKYFPKDQKKEYALTHPKEAQKLIKKRINELSNDLTQKITDTVKKYIEEKLKQYNLNEYSELVLGCTHFPFFKKAF